MSTARRRSATTHLRSATTRSRSATARPPDARPGWVLAGIWSAVLVGVFVYQWRSSSPTPATAFAADLRTADPIRLPIDLDALLAGGSFADRSAGDAGDRYRAAADAYLRPGVRQAYDAPGLERPGATPPPLPLLDDLIDAAAYRQATIFADAPETVINYDRPPQQLEALANLGTVLVRRARGLARDDAAASRLHAEAAVVLGVHLFEERLIHRQFELGYRLIGDAMGVLSALEQVSPDADPARGPLVARARQDFSRYVNDEAVPTWNRLSAVSDLRRPGGTADRAAGDVRQVADDPQVDRLWRTEATLRTGKQRFDAARPADRAAADRRVRRLLDDADAHVRLAAQAASALEADELQAAR